MFDLVAFITQKVRSFERPVTLGIQTNGTRLTPEMVTFFVANNFQVGISLDGPLEINDRLRGETTKLLAGLRYLEEGGQDFTVTTVVSKENVRFLHKVPLMLGGFGLARGFGLDILINKGTGLIAAAEPEELAAETVQLKRVLEAVNKYRSHPLVWREKALVENVAEGSDRAFCHACRNESLAVGPDGLAYPCGQTLGSPAFALGPLDELRTLKSSLSNMRLKGVDCGDCPLHGRCPGECPSRLYFNQGAQAFLVCRMYRAIAEA